MHVEMVRWFRSIRVKLTLWYTFVLLATMVGFGLVAYTYASQTLAENLDRSLLNEVKWVRTYIESKASKVKPSRRYASRIKQKETIVVPQPVADPAQIPDPDEEVWNHIYEHAILNAKKTLIDVIDRKNATRLYSVGEESLAVIDPPLNIPQVTTIRNKKGENLRVAAISTESVRIYVAYRLDDLSDLLDNLFAIFLILVPVTAVVSIGGGWFLANKSLRPVDAVTRTARDITAHNLDQRLPVADVDDEIGRLSSTFNEMIARLNSSFTQVRQFSVDASHELRTPLTIMRGEAEMALRTTKSVDEYRAVLASVIEEISRLTSIIDSLNTLAKADIGRSPVHFEQINMRGMIEELFEDAVILASHKQIGVTLDHVEDVILDGDQVRLRQLLINLVDNAVKYTPEKGGVCLSLHRDDGRARISIADTGIGIPASEQSKIFDRFYRVDKARSRELGGSGLGLSIVKWIVDLHHGQIAVTSEPGKGSIFTVWIPAKSLQS